MDDKSPLNAAYAILLAGGLGTRIRHRVPHLPKPMVPACGRPFLEWVLRYLAKQGCTEFGISTGFEAQAIHQHFDRLGLPGLSIRCAAEPEPLGTGGALRYAAENLPSDRPTWIVCNGDSLCLADLGQCNESLQSPEVMGVLVGVPMADASRYGSLSTDRAGRLVGFEEKRPGSGVINAGVYLLRSTVLRLLSDRTPLSLERDVFPDLLRRGVRLQVCVQDVPFLDIGTEEGLDQAEPFVAGHQEYFA